MRARSARSSSPTTTTSTAIQASACTRRPLPSTTAPVTRIQARRARALQQAYAASPSRFRRPLHHRPAYRRVPGELIPSALYTVEQYANNPVEADHGRLKARLRPMRGLKSYRSARILAAGHAFVQNLRRGHYDIVTDVSGHHRLQKAFDDLAITI